MAYNKSEELLALLNEGASSDKILKAPFGYPGSKARSIKHILEHMPWRDRYVEVCGGSGIVLLNAPIHKFEVFNDAYSGVTDFFRCIRDKNLQDRLVELIENCVNSKEDFLYFKETWNEHPDIVERAFRWVFIVTNSYGTLARNWGTATKDDKFGHTNRLYNRLPKFVEYRSRLRNVVIENCDYRDILNKYDTKKTLFYIDPPYHNSDTGIYKNKINIHSLLDDIFSLDGTVALSGYTDPTIENRPWDDKHSWPSYVSIESLSNSESNNKDGILTKRISNEECLWIKD